MSKYEWESGTITLPTASSAPFRKKIREQANALHVATLEEAKRIVRESGTSSISRFKAYLQSMEVTTQNSRGRSNETPLAVTARGLARSFLSQRSNAGWNRPAPTRVSIPTVAELVAYGVKKYTTSDKVFPVMSRWGGYEATITFDGRNVTWNVDENNHAVESARETFLAGVFFAELGRVNWTRGTGGVLIGNDEYNREVDYAGGGGNYITEIFGPRGIDARIDQYVRQGFNRKQAKEMATPRPEPRRTGFASSWR